MKYRLWTHISWAFQMSLIHDRVSNSSVTNTLFVYCTCTSIYLFLSCSMLFLVLFSIWYNYSLQRFSTFCSLVTVFFTPLTSILQNGPFSLFIPSFAGKVVPISNSYYGLFFRWTCEINTMDVWSVPTWGVSFMQLIQSVSSWIISILSNSGRKKMTVRFLRSLVHHILNRTCEQVFWSPI